MRTPRDAVVVGVEDSPDARSAVRWAAEEAERRGAPLHLLHALGVGYRELPPTTAEYRRMRRRGEQVLAAARSELPPGFPLPVSTEVDILAAAPALVAASSDAQLTVVGARGHSLGHDLLVGSVSLHLAHHAVSSLVVVREPADPSSRQVVVGVDGSPGSEAALRFAVETAARAGLPVLALHGIAHHRNDAGDEEPRRARQEEVIAAAAAPWATKHPEVALTVRVVAAHPARALTDASARARLLVVGSHGHGVLGGLRLGSTGQAALHGAHCSVAIAR